ncbi:MAG: hypothetical protein R3254_10425 [Thiomicrorhabdus sp.]|nr:hypothetical protein [Thiomicrorhabdus sp.]
MSQVNITSGGITSIISRMPWMLFIIGFLLIAEYLEMTLQGTVGYAFITVAVIVLFIEMFKSGDVTPLSFLLDQFWAVVTLVLATGLLTYLYFVTGKEPTFFHWIGFAIILADSLLNPFNSFRTALRNFDVPG